MINSRFKSRRLTSELMDDPELDGLEHRQALAGLARVHWISLGASPVWPWVLSAARSNRGHARVLDVGCGGGSLLLSLAYRARREEIELALTGVDLSATALEVTRERLQRHRFTVAVIRADAVAAPLPCKADVVVCSLFMHHLDELGARNLLRNMHAAARWGCVVVDLQRSALGFGLAWAGTRLLTRSRVVHVDALRSVRAAWTLDEAAALAREVTGCPVFAKRHWPQRWSLAWKVIP